MSTSIEWTRGDDGTPGETWNPVAGCSLVSPGCTNCYAMRMAARLEAMGQPKYAGLTKKVNGRHVWTGKVTTDHAALTIPFSWRKPRRVFVNSMSDLFHEEVPFDYIHKVFAVMAMNRSHTYQILTKRPARMFEYLDGIECDGGTISGIDGGYQIGSAGATMLDGEWIWGEGKGHRRKIEEFIADTHGDASGFDGDNGEPADYELKDIRWPLPSVWLGTSVEDQTRADERSEHLRRCPAAVRFYSVEPMLGPIEHLPLDGISWVIVGGESGPGARPCGVHWVRSIVKQCRAANVPCFVKQLGANPCCEYSGGELGHRIELKDRKGGDPSEWINDLRVREFPSSRMPEVAS